MAKRGSSPVEAGIASELLERLDLVTRSFGYALVINTGGRLLADGLRTRGLTVDETDHGKAFAAAAQGISCDEDRLHVPPGTYDLVIMPSGLDSVDDVPGALIAARTALRPGGLFLACLIGSPSLPVLRDVANDVDAAEGRAVARFHPQIDVRAAGDLLARTGFALPVADNETLSLSYPSFDRLIGDLRASGLTNLLAERHAVTRRWLNEVTTRFAGLSDANGRVHETVTLLILTGWAPE
jgi:SAM-dependent methyltransferase